MTIPSTSHDRRSATLTTLTICPCGYTFLRDEIPLGTKYTVHFDNQQLMDAFCGACKQTRRGMPCIWVEGRLSPKHGGFMPTELLTISEKVDD